MARARKKKIKKTRASGAATIKDAIDEESKDTPEATVTAPKSSKISMKRSPMNKLTPKKSSGRSPNKATAKKASTPPNKNKEFTSLTGQCARTSPYQKPSVSSVVEERKKEEWDQRSPTQRTLPLLFPMGFDKRIEELWKDERRISRGSGTDTPSTSRASIDGDCEDDERLAQTELEDNSFRIFKQMCAEKAKYDREMHEIDNPSPESLARDQIRFAKWKEEDEKRARYKKIQDRVDEWMRTSTPQEKLHEMNKYEFNRLVSFELARRAGREPYGFPPSLFNIPEMSKKLQEEEKRAKEEEKKVKRRAAYLKKKGEAALGKEEWTAAPEIYHYTPKDQVKKESRRELLARAEKIFAEKKEKDLREQGYKSESEQNRELLAKYQEEAEERARKEEEEWRKTLEAEALSKSKSSTQSEPRPHTETKASSPTQKVSPKAEKTKAPRRSAPTKLVKETPKTRAATTTRAASKRGAQETPKTTRSQKTMRTSSRLSKDSSGEEEEAEESEQREEPRQEEQPVESSEKVRCESVGESFKTSTSAQTHQIGSSAERVVSRSAVAEPLALPRVDPRISDDDDLKSDSDATVPQFFGNPLFGLHGCTSTRPDLTKDARKNAFQESLNSVLMMEKALPPPTVNPLPRFRRGPNGEVVFYDDHVCPHHKKIAASQAPMPSKKDNNAPETVNLSDGDDEDIEDSEEEVETEEEETVKMVKGKKKKEGSEEKKIGKMREEGPVNIVMKVLQKRKNDEQGEEEEIRKKKEKEKRSTVLSNVHKRMDLKKYLAIKNQMDQMKKKREKGTRKERQLKNRRKLVEKEIEAHIGVEKDEEEGDPEKEKESDLPSQYPRRSNTYLTDEQIDKIITKHGFIRCEGYSNDPEDAEDGHFSPPDTYDYEDYATTSSDDMRGGGKFGAADDSDPDVIEFDPSPEDKERMKRRRKMRRRRNVTQEEILMKMVEDKDNECETRGLDYLDVLRKEQEELQRKMAEVQRNMAMCKEIREKKANAVVVSDDEGNSSKPTIGSSKDAEMG